MAAPKPLSPSQPTTSSAASMQKAAPQSSTGEVNAPPEKNTTPSIVEDLMDEGESIKDVDPENDSMPQEDTKQNRTAATSEEEQEAISKAVVTPMKLTYANTKNSEAYHAAKSQLESGDFEAALETIATALTLTVSQIPDQDELHESLAPLYYLYGTTLLYSVEESDNPEASIMVNPPQQEQPEEEGSKGEDEGEGDTEEGAEEGDGAEQAAATAASAAASAEDLQIAWENLESARNILSRIIDVKHSAKPNAKRSDDDEDCGGSSSSAISKSDLLLDLAQVHVRLGDLERANGNYSEAIEDYEKSLDIRSSILGEFDRKVADVHYNLGSTYLMLAAEGEKQQSNKNSSISFGNSALSHENAASAHGKTAISPSRLLECREKSIAHYLSCGQSFGGLIAALCNADPTSVMQIPTTNGNRDSSQNSKCEDGVTTAGTSTTPTAATANSSSSISLDASRALRSIRERVASFQPSDSTQSDIVADLKELLDEIQETIDESEREMKALHDVSLMRAKAEAEVQESHDADGSLSTAATARNGGATTTIGFGSTTPKAAASAAAAPINNTPMMIVKKKKKRDASACNGANEKENAKMAKVE